MTTRVTATGKPVGRRSRRSKYHAVPTVVNGLRFASKAEAKRYQELLLRGMAGEIRNLELQPRFPIRVNGERVADYVADFRYEERCTGPAHCGLDICPGGHQIDVVEDVKGVRTSTYVLKKKLVEVIHGIQIREVR